MRRLFLTFSRPRGSPFQRKSAVLAPAGENTIDFVYQADGFSLASKVSLVGLAVFVVYTGYFVWKKKKRC